MCPGGLLILLVLVTGSAARGARDPDLKRALEACDASIGMQERHGNPEPGSLAAAYRRRGDLHGTLLDYAHARADLERACAIYATLPGPGASGDLARCREDLASLEAAFGDLVPAEQDYDEAIGVREDKVPDPVFAKTLHGSGLVLEKLGEIGAARTRLERAIEIQGKVDPDHLDMATYLVGLALAMSRNDEVGAEAPARRALAILQRELGPAAPDTVDAIEAVAAIEVRAGSTREGRELLERVVWTRQATRQSGVRPARSLLRLARLDLTEGRLAEARDLQAAAVESLVTQVGEWSPDVATARAELARTLLRMRHVRAAFRTAREAATAEREHARVVARGLPEDAARRYASAHGDALDVLLTIAARRGSRADDLGRAAWDDLVRSRSIARDAPGPPGAWEDLASARERLARILVRDAGSADAARYARALEDARDREKALGRAMSRSSVEKREEDERDGLGLDAILSRLPSGAGLLSYARYENADAASSTRYVAFAAVGGERTITVVALASASLVDAAVAAWLDTRAHASERRRRGEIVRRRIWDPLPASLRRARELYVVPDGALEGVDLGTLPPDPSSGVLEDDRRILTLSAERELDPYFRFGRTSIFAIMPPSP